MTSCARWTGNDVSRSAESDSLPMPSVRWVLRRRSTPMVVDSSDFSDGRAIWCTAPAAVQTDTLLSAGGRPVVLRLGMPGGRVVTLVSDDRLFTNRLVREWGPGPSSWVSLWIATPASSWMSTIMGSMHRARSPARPSIGVCDLPGDGRSGGRTVGAIALIAAGVRFGPARRIIQRRRRSPLEHVRALATALAAARGHDVAVRLIVQGLRRRLGHAGKVERGGRSTTWLESIAPGVQTARIQEALTRLSGIANRRATAEEVLEAADDVETLWEELPSRHDRRSDSDHRRRSRYPRGHRGPPRPGARVRGAWPGERRARIGCRPDRTGPRAARRRSRHRQDTARPNAQSGTGSRLPAHSVHPRSHAVRHHRGQPSRRAGTLYVSPGYRFSAISCWETRSIVLPPRLKPRFSRPCRSVP